MKPRPVVSSVGMLAVLLLVAGAAHAGLTCSPIPEATFAIDGITSLNAAVINPSSPVTGTVNATGCDIAVYFSPGEKGSVKNATIFGAIKAGIVNNGAKVAIDSNAVYQIGDNPLSGVQYGLAIYVYGLGTRASGDVTNNTIWDYQKNGITIKASDSNVVGNTVIGQGPVSYIAQNGIEIAYGSNSTVANNRVFGMSYTGANNASSAGILLIGGAYFGHPLQTKTLVENNDLSGNDVGVWLANLAADGINPDTSAPGKNVVAYNAIRNNGIFNTTGGPLTATAAPFYPYQAGVTVQDSKDTVVGNSICGIGYTPEASMPPYLYRVDSSLAVSLSQWSNGCDTDHDGPGWGGPHEAR
ncbi:MAG TPA: right-handed parallel beta-helix repeat-containing protein [Candidatus Binataceae bacterium]|nr:right-handed parallel beta-helix repeat-containing protein [Candidatus Binataceae bacterium]